MNFQEAGTDLFFSDGTIEKVLSNTMWNCGLTCPIEVFNMRETFPVWIGYLPMYAPTLIHLYCFGMKLAPSICASSTYTRRKKVWLCLMLILLCIAQIVFACNFPDFLRQRLFSLNFACFNANGPKERLYNLWRSMIFMDQRCPWFIC